MEYLELICKNEEIDTEVLINELEEEQRRREEFEQEMAQDLNKWIQYQTSDETEIIKDISKIYSMNLSDARQAAKREGFIKTELFDIEGAQAYIFFNDKDLIISCRGTQPSEINDIMGTK